MGLGQPQTTPVPSAPGLECFQVPSGSQDGGHHGSFPWDWVSDRCVLCHATGGERKMPHCRGEAGPSDMSSLMTGIQGGNREPQTELPV